VLRIAWLADPGHNDVQPEGPAIRYAVASWWTTYAGTPTVVPHEMSCLTIITPEDGMIVGGRCVGTGGVRRRGGAEGLVDCGSEVEGILVR
jgi:hypothetical protein